MCLFSICLLSFFSDFPCFVPVHEIKIMDFITKIELHVHRQQGKQELLILCSTLYQEVVFLNFDNEMIVIRENCFKITC